jgi:hypothetical protein
MEYGGAALRVAGVIDRDVMISHPFDDGVGSHRVLARHDDLICPSANGRDAVPTLPRDS